MYKWCPAKHFSSCQVHKCKQLNGWSDYFQTYTHKPNTQILHNWMNARSNKKVFFGQCCVDAQTTILSSPLIKHRNNKQEQLRHINSYSDGKVGNTISVWRRLVTSNDLPNRGGVLCLQKLIKLAADVRTAIKKPFESGSAVSYTNIVYPHAEYS